MAAYDPDAYPGTFNTETIGGVKYFKIGPAGWSQMTFAESKIVEFKVGDEYRFSFYGYKDAAAPSFNAYIRYVYTDSTYSTAGATLAFNMGTTESKVEVNVKITYEPTSGKTISRVVYIIHKNGTEATAYYYLRRLSLRKRFSGDLIVDGTVTAAHLVANSITTEKILASAITAAKIDIADLFAAAATINAIKTMKVASLLNGSVLELSEARSLFRTPEFLVEVPGEDEEGEEKLRISSNGAYIPQFTSPQVARRVPGGVYTVGAGGDYSALSDAFAAIECSQLDSDIVLKLLYDDPGGTLRGTGGGYRVIVTSANLFDFNATPDVLTSVSVATTVDYGVKVTATSGGVSRAARYYLGRVGDLGIAGKQITLAVGTITNSGGTYAVVAAFLYNETTGASTWLSGLSSSNTSNSFVIPEDTADDIILRIILYVSDGTTACATGAWVSYDRVRIEIGSTVQNLPVGACSIAQLTLIGADLIANVSRLSFPAGLVARHCDLAISKSKLYGEIGLLAEMSRVRMRDNSGSCTTAVKADCSQVYVTGPAPGGSYSGDWVNTTTATISGTGTPSTTLAKTLTSNSTGTYTSYWWTGDRSIRQGYTTSNGRIKGGMWWDLTAIPTGATVSSMKLTIKRMAGYGKGDEVTVKAYGTASTARTGAPALSSSGYVLGAIGEGATKTLDLPTALVTGLANGTYKGLVLYSDDTSVLSGKTYSANYARVEGTDGTAPKLAVTYTV